ncbi:MAG TPA: hypothetical protein VF997_00585, partial [Polyangia bacterium]
CGIILYEMLTGRLPFEAESAVRLLSMQITAAPPPPRAVAPDAHIPAALEQVVLRALAKRREDRFDSATELLHALDDAVAAASPSGEAPSGAPAARAPRYGHPRSRRIVVGALALGLAAFVLADHHGAAAPAPVVAAAPIAADAGKRLERTRVERLRKPHAR